jgi:hypothetical protein
MVRMNPGYISFLLLCVAIILLSFGWKEHLLKGVSQSAIVVFLICWTAGYPYHLTLSKQLHMNGSYVLLIFYVIWILYKVQSRIEMFHMMTITLLIAAAYILLNQWFAMKPVFTELYSIYSISLILMALAAVLIRMPLQQFVVVTLGLMIGDIGFIKLQQGDYPAVLGTPAFYDQWWVVYAGTRLLSGILEQAWRGFNGFIRLWSKD